jgi:hypothetical protein
MKTCSIPDPVRFRAQCTGVGSTRAKAEHEGMERSQRVIDSAPDAQRKHAVGYPAPTPDAYAYAMDGLVSRMSLKRC